MTGKRQVFSDEENNVLRAALRKFRDTNDLTQKQIGELLGIEQQNAGRLLAKGRAGMSRDTANKFARTVGFRDAEHFLLENGVFAQLEEPPQGNPWYQRDAAVTYARKLGYPEAAITAVITRYGSHDYTSKEMKWWNNRIVLESLETPPDAPPAVSPVVAPKKRSKAKRAAS